MKFLIQQGQGANFFIRRAWVNSLHRIGEQVYFWNDQQHSVYDVFHELEPDVFIGATYQLNRAIVTNLLSRPNIKIILYASHWGTNDVNIDTDTYPILIANDEEKKLVEQLSSHPGFQHLLCQYSQTQMEKYETHDLWKNLGLTPNGLLLCADTTYYYLDKPDEDSKTQISYIGGRWAYKASSTEWIDRLAYPSPYKIRIFGSGWSNVNAVGRCDEETARKHYASTIVCPNVYEKHSLDIFSDINARGYEAAAVGGGIIISQDAIGLEEVYEDDEVVKVKTFEEFKYKLDYFIANPEERKPYVVKACKKTYAKHTGFIRTATIMDLLGYNKIEQQLIDKAKEEYNTVNEFFNRENYEQ